MIDAGKGGANFKYLLYCVFLKLSEKNISKYKNSFSLKCELEGESIIKWE